jgi:hypothetical protein
MSTISQYESFPGKSPHENYLLSRRADLGRLDALSATRTFRNLLWCEALRKGNRGRLDSAFLAGWMD